MLDRSGHRTGETSLDKPTTNDDLNQNAAGGTRRPSLASLASQAIRSSRNLHVAVLLVLPILLVWINNTIIFGNPEDVDSSVYSGFHLHFPEFLRSRFWDTYYATRIPWIALGYVAHRFLDNEHALYAEHILVFYLAVFSLYAAVSAIFADRLAAFAAAMLLGTNAWFLASAGWDYVDGPYTACLLLSLAAMAGAAMGRRWRLAAIVWGAAVAMTVSLYVLWAILVLIEIAMFFGLNRLGHRRNVFSVAALGSAGALAAFVCMGGISWLAGGKLLYLLPQITILPAVAANRPRYTAMLMGGWMWQARWLLIPGAIWVFSAIWGALHARPALRHLRESEPVRDPNTLLWIACVGCLAGFLAFVALQANDFQVLAMEDKTRALMPFEYIVLGGALALAGRTIVQRHKLIYALTVIAVTLAPWVASGFNLIAPNPPYFMGPAATLFWVGVGALVLLIALNGGLWKYALATILFSVVGFGADNMKKITFPPDPFYKQAMLAIFEASQDIAPYDPTTEARFWFDAKDPLSTELRNVSSTYLYEYSLLNENFPSLKDDNGRVSPIAPGDRVIILTSGGNPLPAADRAIASNNLVFREVAAKQISRPGIAFTFVVADAVPSANAITCDAPPAAVSIDKIPLAALQPQHGGSISAQEGDIALTAPPQQWAYAATALLPLDGRASGSGIVCVRLQVQEGKLGIGVLARGSTSQMLAEQPVEATKTPAEIKLALPDIARAGSIVMRSWSPNGESVKARISSIELRRPRLPERSANAVPAGPVGGSNAISCSSPPDSVLADKIPLASLQPQNGGSVLAQDGKMVLTTPPQQWAYAATAPLPPADTPRGSGVVCVRLQVDEGKLGVGVYAHGDNAQMLAERPVEATGGSTDVELALPDLTRAGSIVLRSWSPNGESVKARISSIELRRPRLPERSVSSP